MSYFIKFLKITFSLLVIGAVIFLFFSIISYSSLDPSVANIKNYIKIHNLFGKYGAIIVDPIIQILGYAIILAILFYLIFAIKLLKNIANKFFIYRNIILLCNIIILAILLAFIPIYFVVDGIGYGGIIGDYLKQLLLVYIEREILFILLSCIFILLSIFCLGLTLSEWKSICKYIYNTIKILIKGVEYAIFKLFYQKKQLYSEYTNKQIDPFIRGSKENKDIQNKKRNLKSRFTLLNVSILNKIQLNRGFKGLLIGGKIREKQENLRGVLRDYGIKGEIVNCNVGPVVTLYELEPIAGTKASRVIGLSDDISRSMSAVSTRITVIPGKNALGIEIPNEQREVIYLRELIESKEYQENNFKLPLILGKDISGQSVVTDLVRMPHLLLAGTTGSGKSVAINIMILSILYSCTTKQCRFVMIDPKMLELSVYDGIPHLLSPVVTEPKKAVEVLKWVVQEIEKRYRVMASLGVRNIFSFNELLLKAAKKGSTLKKVIQNGFDPETGEPIYEEIDLGSEELPYIVVIVDEMADLMLLTGNEIERYIQRIAQMARASGIHLIMATQRPSVDIITGVIKANFPTRISFYVTSKIDSRTILGEQGAEQLLGMGDMLYMTPGGNIRRVHGPFVSDVEVKNVVKELKKKQKVNYNLDFNIT